jgi:transposase
VNKQAKARLRAEMILRVRTGEITPSEAAHRLGVSRKTYYEWEKKGLEGLMEALSDSKPGRPQSPKPDLEKAKLERKVQELEKRLELMGEIQGLREVLHDLRGPEPPQPKSKKRATKKASKRTKKKR